ncbi:MAG: hypothetical protein HY360_11790 [Verrucomicrobia bacterium]|nr:hypothetical protein [Verrucomicrobiota bacterium]
MKSHVLLAMIVTFVWLNPLSSAFAERQQLVPLKIEQPPTVDGMLDDACWQRANKIELQPMRDSDAGIPPARVQAAYTSNAVYFAFTCIEPRADKLKKGEPGRGASWQLDSVELFLDTDSDQIGYLQFGVSAGETWMANYCAQPRQAVAIGGEWKFRTRVQNDRYTVEIELLFAQFPVSKEPLLPTWNVAFGRYQVLDFEGRNKIAVWKGYLMDGLYHQPKTWGDLGPFEMRLAALRQSGEPKPGSGGWEFPAGIPPVYTLKLPNQLDESLRWVEKERLRIAWSWLTSPVRYLNNKQHQHEFQQVVDVVVPAGFNVVIPNASAKTRKRTPYYLWANLEGMVRVRLAGARTMFNTGYLWASHEDRAMKLRRYVAPTGETNKIMICPLEPHPWRENLAAPMLDALAEAKRMGAPDLFFGVMFDMEPQSHSDYCHCDHCWGEYARLREGVQANVPVKERNLWLLMHQKLGDYKAWQKQAVTELVRRELEAVRKVAPALVFGFYPYHHGNSWMTEAVAAAVSTPRAPAILMDDETYWGGYSEKPQHVPQTREATTKFLGHEPFYGPSIAYCAPERNADGSPRYPAYTSERAGREVYLLTKSAIACIVWGGTRDSGKDLLADQKDYYPNGFAKAHQLLAKEGVIDQASPKLPAGQERERLDRAMAQLRQEIGAMWGEVYGEAFAHADQLAAAAFDGAPLVLTKELKASSIYNTTGADYVFDLTLKARPKNAKLTIIGAPCHNQGERTHLRIEFNGAKVDYVRKAFHENGRIEVAVPPSLIREHNRVVLAYFLGDSYAETGFDNSVTIRHLELRLE